MNPKLIRTLMMIIVIVAFSMLLAACTSSSETQENTDAENESSSPAMVDSVTVEPRDGHYYAIINGNYPDPCTYVSSIEQDVEGNAISITILTESPDDFMCAAVLTPFTVDVLLTTGGLMPQEYTVVVNEGSSATFSLE